MTALDKNNQTAFTKEGMEVTCVYIKVLNSAIVQV